MINAQHAGVPDLFSRATLTQLKELTSQQLLDLYRNLSDRLGDCLAKGASLEVLNECQSEISRVKEALYRKANLSSSSTFQKAYFTLFLA